MGFNFHCNGTGGLQARLGFAVLLAVEMETESPCFDVLVPCSFALEMQSFVLCN